MKRARSNVSHGTKLPQRQLRFVEEYLLELNATKAAIKAGYSEKTARQIGSRLLTNMAIKSVINQRLKKQGDKNEELKQKVINEIGRIAFFDVRKAFDNEGKPLPVHQLDDDTAASIAGIEVEVEHSKTRKINEDGEDVGDSIQTEIARTHKFKLADKHSALATLARHLGMFDKDKVKVTGDKDHPVVHKIDLSDELADIMSLEQLEEMKRRGLAKSNAG